MKPYYQEDGITIYHGDCLEVLPALEAESVDLVLTDPPYVGMTGGYSYQFPNLAQKVTPTVSVGDPWGATLNWVPDAIRVARLGVLVFTTYHALPETAVAFAQLRRAVLITWHKRNAAPAGKNVPRFTEEYIWGFAKRPGLSWDQFKSTLIDLPALTVGAIASPERFTDPQGRALHPTQKPLSVIKRLLCVGGNSVLDPFMGTGTTLRVAKDLGRQAIGIEIEERYCEIAAQRLGQQVLPWHWGGDDLPKSAAGSLGVAIIDD